MTITSRPIITEELALVYYVVGKDKGRHIEIKTVGSDYYDVHFEYLAPLGIDDKLYLASAWLPLAIIGCVDWTRPVYAHLSSYPTMVKQGDWSGIRDSKWDNIWKMFDQALDDLGLFNCRKIH